MKINNPTFNSAPLTFCFNITWTTYFFISYDLKFQLTARYLI